jgi:hypothetical protein
MLIDCFAAYGDSDDDDDERSYPESRALSQAAARYAQCPLHSSILWG